MSEKLEIEYNGSSKEYLLEKNGNVSEIILKVKIKVAEKSFLHIGAAPSPLTEKHAEIFKINRIPVIPASSIKGALRHQLEILFIDKNKDLSSKLNLDGDKSELLKPCIPAPSPSYAEKELLKINKYRGRIVNRAYTGYCKIEVEEKKIKIPQIDGKEIGICPVCYFMGAGGIMGFLRIENFFPERSGGIVDQTNIRIDRKTNIAAKGAKVDGEQVEPGAIFTGKIRIVLKEPIMQYQGIQFGDPREISGTILDKWLEYWDEEDKNMRVAYIIEEILIPAIKNIKILGGYRSKGAGRVNISILYN